jgi:hypothetical protein
LATQEILTTKLEAEKAKLENEIAYKVKTMQQHSSDYTEKYRNQVKKMESKVNLQSFMHLQNVYVDNLKSSEYELEGYLQKENTIEFKRTRERVFNDDILALKKTVIEYEEYIKNLKELVDKDQAEELIDQLTKNDQKRIDLIDICDQVQKLKEEVDNARRAKV